MDKLIKHSNDIYNFFRRRKISMDRMANEKTIAQLIIGLSLYKQTENWDNFIVDLEEIKNLYQEPLTAIDKGCCSDTKEDIVLHKPKENFNNYYIDLIDNLEKRLFMLKEKQKERENSLNESKTFKSFE